MRDKKTDQQYIYAALLKRLEGALLPEEIANLEINESMGHYVLRDFAKDHDLIRIYTATSDMAEALKREGAQLAIKFALKWYCVKGALYLEPYSVKEKMLKTIEVFETILEIADSYNITNLSELYVEAEEEVEGDKHESRGSY